MTTPQNVTALLAAALIIILLAIAVAWVHNHPPQSQQNAPAQSNTTGTLQGNVIATTTL